MPVLLQLAPYLTEVIDFAVEDHPNGLLPVRHGLMTAAKVDDREPAKTQAEGPADVVPIVIRASMDEGPGHRLDVTARDGLRIPEIILSANATHTS
jgi:hypothetical protein